MMESEGEQLEHPILSKIKANRSHALDHESWTPQVKEGKVTKYNVAQRVFLTLQHPAPPNDTIVREPYDREQARDKKQYEDRFEKPYNHIYIHRDFATVGDKAEKEICAKANLGLLHPTETQIADMMVFMDVMGECIKEAAAPLMKAKVLEEARRRSIRIGGRTVSTHEEFYRAWKDPDDLSTEFVEDVFHCVYNVLDGITWRRLEFDVMRDLALWYSDVHVVNSKNPKKQKGFVCAFMQNVKRNIFSKQFSRAAQLPHGVLLTVSGKQANGKAKSTTTMFNMEKNVKKLDG